MRGIGRGRFMGPAPLSIVSFWNLIGQLVRGGGFVLTGLAPPSPNVTLQTDVDFGILAAKQKVGSLVSTVDGPFCYMYV